MHYYERFCLSNHFQLSSEITTIWHSITIQGIRLHRTSEIHTHSSSLAFFCLLQYGLISLAQIATRPSSVDSASIPMVRGVVSVRRIFAFLAKVRAHVPSRRIVRVTNDLATWTNAERSCLRDSLG